MGRDAERLLASIVAAATLVLAGCGGGSGESGSDGVDFDAGRAFDDLRAQVELGPRPAGSAANRRQARFLARRLREAGVEDVRIQRPHRNVVGTIPGSGPGAVVVGAHHDTVDIEGLVGANDGASGVAVVLELARVLPRPMPGPELRIALFDAEEARPGRDFAADGTRGSRQYVSLAGAGGGQGAPPLESIEAMVLFDLVGDCDLQIPLESNSDPGLYAAFADAARRLNDSPEPFVGETAPIEDDHVPFVEAGIPAVDLIDFTYGSEAAPGPHWHTPEDTLDKVCPESLEAVGEPALRALPEIGSESG